MWKASTDVKAPAPEEADDWETDPDFVNDVTEQEQRWGPGGRHVEAIDMAKLREEVFESDKQAKKQQYEAGPKSSYGYGGKFGVQADRMDKSAVGHDYVGKTEKHVSQKDYAQGFGGKFGVQTDRMDASAVGHDYVGKVEKHASQADYAKGFGGKYGVQTDRVDKSAAGWEHKEQIEKHPSQKDYSVGFGGKFGVQSDRQDASAAGWDHHEAHHTHESQKDYKEGFGGKFGVQTDRQDASAVGWDHQEKTPAHASQVDHKKGFGGKFGVQTDRVDKCAHRFDQVDKVGTNYTKQRPDIGAAKPSSIRAKFENMAKEKEQEAQQSVQRIRQERQQIDKSLSEKEKDRVAIEKAISKEEEPTQPKPEDTHTNAPTNTNINTHTTKKTEEKVDIVASATEAPKTPAQEVKQVILPDVTLVAEGKKEEKIDIKEEKEEITRQPTIVVSPVGWESEMAADADADDEDGYTARALYDYQAAAPDEISFDPDDLITNIVMITRRPTIVVSPVGWESEMAADAVADDEDSYTLRALYDYQAAAPDEISFDPDDLITNIVMIDEGWWQGLCKGAYGLFPANYVQLQDK